MIRSDENDYSTITFTLKAGIHSASLADMIDNLMYYPDNFNLIEKYEQVDNRKLKRQVQELVKRQTRDYFNFSHGLWNEEFLSQLSLDGQSHYTDTIVDDHGKGKKIKERLPCSKGKSNGDGHCEIIEKFKGKRKKKKKKKNKEKEKNKECDRDEQEKINGKGKGESKWLNDDKGKPYELDYFDIKTAIFDLENLMEQDDMLMFDEFHNRIIMNRDKEGSGSGSFKYYATRFFDSRKNNYILFNYCIDKFESDGMMDKVDLFAYIVQGNQAIMVVKSSIRPPDINTREYRLSGEWTIIDGKINELIKNDKFVNLFRLEIIEHFRAGLIFNNYSCFNF